MILSVLLSLASLSWGQLAQDATSYQQTVSPDFEQTLSNLGKDVRELQSGRPTITGLPTFQDGVKFGDGSIQTGAGAVLIATQTFSGTNTFYGLIASSAAPSVPIVNGIFKELTAKAIVLFDGSAGTVTYGVNITSMTKTATGKYMLHFARDFASASYVGVCGNGDANTNNTILTCTNPNGGAQQDAHTCGVASLSVGAVPAFADSARIFCAFFGAQ